MIATDVIGTLYTPGTYAADGSVIDAPVALAGYHVNTSHPVADWAAFKVTPARPRRVFGGGVTHYYTFADEAEFEAALDAADLSIPVVTAVPQSVTPRQIRQALTRAGLRTSVEAAVSAGDQDTKDWYEFATEFRRDSSVVTALGIALAVSDAQLDDLWIVAGSL